MNISECRIKVRYVETDQMGIVHHSNYYAWFEVGRTEFMDQNGMTYKEMEEKGVMLPVLESNCKYIEGAKYEDELIVQTWIEEVNPVKIIFGYNVIREKDNKIISKGSTKHAFVNMNFKITNIKKNYTEIWNMISNL